MYLMPHGFSILPLLQHEAAGCCGGEPDACLALASQLPWAPAQAWRFIC